MAAGNDLLDKLSSETFALEYRETIAKQSVQEVRIGTNKPVSSRCELLGWV